MDLALTLTSDIRLGLEGSGARGRTLLKEGDTRFCALSWGHRRVPENYEDAYRRLVWTAHHWQHWLARGRFPDHRWRSHLARSALTLKGLTFAPTGSIAAAATTSLPETPGGRAQLGLPVHLDARRDVRAVGPVYARLRVGGQRLLCLPVRPGRTRPGRPADRLRHRRPPRARRARARPPERLPGRPSGAHRQRRVPAGPARRLGRGARFHLPAHQVTRPARRPGLEDGQAAGGARPGTLARA